MKPRHVIFLIFLFFFFGYVMNVPNDETSGRISNEKLKEFNEYLKGRKVAVIGLGVSNVPLIDYLRKYKANVTVFDNRNIDDIDKRVMDKVVGYGLSLIHI